MQAIENDPVTTIQSEIYSFSFIDAITLNEILPETIERFAS